MRIFCYLLVLDFDVRNEWWKWVRDYCSFYSVAAVSMWHGSIQQQVMYFCYGTFSYLC